MGNKQISQHQKQLQGNQNSPKKAYLLSQEEYKYSEDWNECPICLIDFDDKQIIKTPLKCGHSICKQCIAGIRKQNYQSQNCPLCRKVLVIIPKLSSEPSFSYNNSIELCDSSYYSSTLPYQGTPEYDYRLKLVFLGHSGVGKTSLQMRYCEQTFGSHYNCTIGVDFRIKTTIEEGKTVKAMIWDTMGAERFNCVSRSYFRGAHGFLLCFDISNRESFEKIDYWYEQIQTYCMGFKQIILIGCKSDLEDQRKVDSQEAEEWAKEKNMIYLETSAKIDEGVDFAFSLFIQKITQVLKNYKAAQENGIRQGKIGQNIKKDNRSLLDKIFCKKRQIK